ncbi:MAG TPA: LysM peptidoglycan-binding domain-containing protein [Streptosporangiaceae bacterium]|nr:LysM peptidoglycan-binding domain-containing protein [Streptosporangiaceae bacterium]
MDVPAVVRGTVVSRREAPTPRTPIRLTRRGRTVVAGLLVTALTVAALLMTLLASGGAQATNHGQPRAGYQGMHQIVVRPGQSLWSIAASAEPSADTRVVVQEIMTANALTSADISAGQLLWVPR